MIFLFISLSRKLQNFLVDLFLSKNTKGLTNVFITSQSRLTGNRKVFLAERYTFVTLN
ncbi:hypothetical protein JCM19294_1230 [Nonlabens tegetincola]|uniref:Uncharacterized protein n=1 Tax=Nonlabens tegetincola TaxID=323273 RepID=A0A090QN35_9FLAO|nr:hypothetical protein JCM19294_1230 [Nonlabens tegetincola]